MILNEKIIKVESKIGYTFNNKCYLLEAITHKSCTVDCGYDYERLEFLGDAVLQLYVSQFLYRNENLDQGQLTVIRSQMVSRKTLTKVIERLDFEECFIVGKSVRDEEGKIKGSFLGDFFESILAAIYLDSDLQKVYKFLRKIYKINGDLIIDEDYKSKLQEILLKTTKKLPKYDTIQNDEYYESTVQLNEDVFRGIGNSKKEAEQIAAKNAIEALI
ncbi:MAG: ribonuclease III [Candidatus Cloacimonadota bacterium]|nr:MAG: ribonuclease III [Candidatus Cloacimonadota bacterium]